VNRKIISQVIGTLFLGLLVAQMPFSKAEAQPQTDPGTTIDQFLRSNAPLPKADANVQQQYVSLRRWLGAYQGISKEDKNYLATFENGSLPVFVSLNAKGQIESYGIGCPRSQILSLSQMPDNLKQATKQAWSKCTSIQH
jgi:hypothetical protein